MLLLFSTLELLVACCSNDMGGDSCKSAIFAIGTSNLCKNTLLWAYSQTIGLMQAIH